MILTLSPSTPVPERLCAAAFLAALDDGLGFDLVATICDVLAEILAQALPVPLETLFHLHGVSLTARMTRRLRERRLADHLASAAYHRANGKEPN